MRADNSALQAFRGDGRAAIGLHPLEKTLLALVGALLCLMPWMVGTMRATPQWISLGLAAAAFVVSLINRHYRDELAPQGDFKLIMWPKLLRFPLAWLGLLLLAYVLTQALNPAWVYTRNATSWWLEPINYIEWLPAGMETPFKDMNPWRVLVIYGTAWLTVCALWVGVTRRVTVQWLFGIVAANAALLAIVGILQRVTGTKDILWFWNTKGISYFFSTIIYKNHAGAYFNLVLMLTVGLLYWHFSRAERRLDRSSPAPVFGFICVLLGISVLLTNSRAGILLLMGFSLIAFIGFIVRCTLYRSESRSPWTITVLCATFALFVGLGAYFLNAGTSFERVGKLIENRQTDSSVVSRSLVRDATWDMAKDNLVTGWGAGSYRHYFPVYQRNYPEIYKAQWGDRTVTFRWEYAHNDYVQLLAELGLIGAGILGAMLLTGLRHLIRHRIWHRPHLMFILLALVITATHAWVDFQFHNPAILVLWCASAALVGRWAEFESRSSSR